MCVFFFVLFDLGFVDSKTWFTHTDRWYFDLHKWPTIPGSASGGIWWMDFENIIPTATRFWNIWVPSINGTENQSGFSAFRHRWVEDFTILKHDAPQYIYIIYDMPTEFHVPLFLGEDMKKFKYIAEFSHERTIRFKYSNMNYELCFDGPVFCGSVFWVLKILQQIRSHFSMVEDRQRPTNHCIFLAMKTVAIAIVTNM